MAGNGNKGKAHKGGGKGGGSPMKHKRLIKQGGSNFPKGDRAAVRPLVASTPVKVAVAPIPAKTVKVDPAGMRVVEGLINLLPNVPDPDAALANIQAQIGQYHIDLVLFPDLETSMNKNFLAAWANFIVRRLDAFTTTGTPDFVKAEIEKALEKLGIHEQRAFEAVGVVDREAFDAKIDEAYKEALALLEEKKLEAKIDDAKRIWARMPDEYDYAAVAAKLRHILDELGEHQNRAFPRDVTTREEFDRKIDERCERKKWAIAVATFRELGANSMSASYLNPDEQVARIREAVASMADGDYARISEARPPESADIVVQQLDIKHTKAMNIVADYVIRHKRNHHQMYVYTNSAIGAKQLISAGYHPREFLKRLETDGRSGWMDDPIDPADQEEILREVALNEPVRFALITKYFADRGEIHDGMMAKTLARIDAAGGYDQLDVALARVGVTPEEWAELQAFLEAGRAELAEKAEREAGAEATALDSPAETFVEAAAAVTMGAAEIITEETLIEEPPEPEPEPETVAEPEPPAVILFDLRAEDVQPVIDALADDPSTLDRLADIIEEIPEWNLAVVLNLEKIYRAHIQNLLASNTDEGMDVFDMHVTQVSPHLRGIFPEFETSLAAYAQVIKDRAARIRIEAVRPDPLANQEGVLDTAKVG